jgi:phage gp29-like protein
VLRRRLDGYHDFGTGVICVNNTKSARPLSKTASRPAQTVACLNTHTPSLSGCQDAKAYFAADCLCFGLFHFVPVDSCPFIGGYEVVAIQIYSQKSNAWRDAYNPLRGMSLPKVISLLDAGERGQYADLQWFYHYMERSDAMVFSVMQRRRAALLSCDWDIKQVSGDRVQGSGKVDQALADEQAAMLREAYDRIENLRDAVAFLFSGFFRGFAHLEKHYSESGLIQRLEPVEQWFWVRDGMYGAWEYNQNAVSGRYRGLPIEPENFVILDTVALNRLLSVLYMGRTLTLKDWDSFLEVYGIPSVFLVGPPNTPEAKEEEYQRIAEQLIADGRGYLPNGSDIKYVNGGGNRPPFRERIEYLDRQITLVATGGLLTMLTQAGSGTLAGDAHTETFMQIARGDALTVSEVLQEHVDGPLLAEFFPGEPVLAYFEFAPGVSDQSSRVVDDALKLAQAGYAVDPGELSEKTGYRVERSAATKATAIRDTSQQMRRA